LAGRVLNRPTPPATAALVAAAPPRKLRRVASGEPRLRRRPKCLWGIPALHSIHIFAFPRCEPLRTMTLATFCNFRLRVYRSITFHNVKNRHDIGIIIPVQFGKYGSMVGVSADRGRSERRPPPCGERSWSGSTCRFLVLASRLRLQSRF
jgi:hypothetical protein